MEEKMAETDVKFLKPENYVNRELSWLEFNYRILGEARDKTTPLFERLKFLSITASNLDEFFMVRVASLKDMVHANYTKRDIAGMTAQEQLDAIDGKTHELVENQYRTYNRMLLPLLKQHGLRVVTEHEKLTKEEAVYVDRYFEESVYPVLTPMAVDSSRPFPLIHNKSLNIAALVRKKKGDGELEFAMVCVPGGLPRVVELPCQEGKSIIYLEEVIERNIDKLFLNYDIISCHPFRVMRNADLSIDEDEAEDLLKEIEQKLKKRQWGEVIRLDIEKKADKRLLDILKKELHVGGHAIYEIDGPLDLTVLMKVFGLPGFDEFKTSPYTPQPVPALMNEDDIFANIRKGDILLHHPYQSFDPVVNFVRSAARDPEVLAIKQTLYRVSGNSPIIAALAEAADNGKQVSVLVELKARFDEENNINWAKMLEKAGCHVIYGLVGLKTHSKIALVVRREEDGIRRYVHLGTGNYNDSTAKLYTDCGIFTCDGAIGEDATAVFNMLSGYSEPLSWNELAVAPIWLRTKFTKLIRRETKHAKEGKPAKIIAKMNSLCDPGIIESLYEASAAGVKIQLIVRGICCMIPGIKGYTENIKVISIVGRFLEHSRIYRFGTPDREKVYIASADYMTRNTLRRVEVAAPVLDDTLCERLDWMFDTMMKDDEKGKELTADGDYVDRDINEEKLDSQEVFYETAYKNTEKK